MVADTVHVCVPADDSKAEACMPKQVMGATAPHSRGQGTLQAPGSLHLVPTSPPFHKSRGPQAGGGDGEVPDGHAAIDDEAANTGAVRDDGLPEMISAAVVIVVVILGVF